MIIAIIILLYMAGAAYTAWRLTPWDADVSPFDLIPFVFLFCVCIILWPLIVAFEVFLNFYDE